MEKQIDALMSKYLGRTTPRAAAVVVYDGECHHDIPARAIMLYI